MIEFFYFDLGNVLINFDHRRACRQVAELAQLSAERVWSVLFEGELQARYEIGHLTTEEVCAEFCRRTGSNVDVAAFALAASDIFWANEAIWPLIDRLHREGRRMGVLSNTCDAHWSFVTNDRFPQLRERFSEFVLSFEAGVAKPEPQIYELATVRAGVPANHIFFTDDRWENVAAAQEAGWQAFLFESAETTAEQLWRLGVWECPFAAEGTNAMPRRKRKRDAQRTTESQPESLNLLWSPRWYGLDPSLAIGADVELQPPQVPVDKAPASLGTQPWEFVHRIETTPRPTRWMGTVIAIQHPQLGPIESVETGSLDYVLTLASGERVIVNAEENPGHTFDWPEAIHDWSLVVTISDVAPIESGE